MTNPFSHLPDFKLQVLFGYMAGMEAKAEVFMADAIEEMHRIADGLTGQEEPPIPTEERRAAVLRLCQETFDRLQNERAANLAEWQRRCRPKP